ncbi:unnamed protein product [Pleuronectes platessa]|uniref:Uncharacterized protein n=1 Tax=Pleuronectes platessa TaxID=8262 RepID=A0A9N7YPH7_PLEPL|nr:unnamed protein product [Pleuronectes platessa]
MLREVDWWSVFCPITAQSSRGSAASPQLNKASLFPHSRSELGVSPVVRPLTPAHPDALTGDRLAFDDLKRLRRVAVRGRAPAAGGEQSVESGISFLSDSKRLSD